MAGSFGFANLTNPNAFQPHNAGIAFGGTSLNAIQSALSGGAQMPGLSFSPSGGGSELRYNNQLVGFLPGSAFSQAQASAPPPPTGAFNPNPTGTYTPPVVTQPAVPAGGANSPGGSNTGGNPNSGAWQNGIPPWAQPGATGNGAGANNGNTTNNGTTVPPPGGNIDPNQPFEPVGGTSNPPPGPQTAAAFTPQWMSALQQAQGFWDPVRYGSTPSIVFANLVQQGQGPPTGQGNAAIQTWWENAFLPEYNRLRNGGSTTSEASGGGGANSAGGDGGTASLINSLFGGSPTGGGIPGFADVSGFNPNATFNATINAPNPDDIFGALEGRLGDVQGQIGGLGVGEDFLRQLTGVENRLVGPNGAGGILGQLQDASNFSQPQALLDTQGTAGDVTSLLRDIGLFETPQALADTRDLANETAGILDNDVLGSFGRQGGVDHTLAKAIGDANLLKTRLQDDAITGFENPEGLTEALSGVNELRTQAPLARAGVQNIINTARGGEDTLAMLSSIVGGVPNPGNLAQTLDRFDPTNILTNALDTSLDGRLGAFAGDVGDAIDVPGTTEIASAVGTELDPTFTNLRRDIGGDFAGELSQNNRFSPLDDITGKLAPLETLRTDVGRDIAGELSSNNRFSPLDDLTQTLAPLGTLQQDIGSDLAGELSSNRRFSPLDDLSGSLEALQNDIGNDVSGELLNNRRFSPLDNLSGDLESLRSNIGGDVASELTNNNRFDPLDRIDSKLDPLATLQSDIGRDFSGELLNSRRLNPLDDLSGDLGDLRNNIGRDVGLEIGGNDRFDPLDSLNSKLNPLDGIETRLGNRVDGGLADLRTDIGGDLDDSLRTDNRFNPLDELNSKLNPLGGIENRLATGLGEQIGGVAQSASDLINPRLQALETGMGSILPEDLKDLPGDLQNVPSDLGAIRQQLDGSGGISDIFSELQTANENITGLDFAKPQDVQGISAEDLENILSSVAGSGGGGGVTVDTQGLPLTETDAGGFLQQLQNQISGNFGSFNPTADDLRNDPQAASLLADLEQRQETDYRQQLENLSRFGVLRDGDSARLLPEMASDHRREELDVLSDAAQRSLDKTQTATSQGLDLSSLLNSRELGLGELLGSVGGQRTISGQQSDLDVIGAAISALDPSLKGKYDDLASLILDMAKGLDPVLRSRLKNSILN